MTLADLERAAKEASARASEVEGIIGKAVLELRSQRQRETTELEKAISAKVAAEHGYEALREAERKATSAYRIAKAEYIATGRQPEAVGRYSIHHVVYGSAWGADPMALIDDKEAKLIWIPARTVYVGRSSGNQYCPAELVLVRDRFGDRKTLQDGGRLSEKLLQRKDVQQAIIEQWGHQVAEMVRPDKTIIFKDIT